MTMSLCARKPHPDGRKRIWRGHRGPGTEEAGSWEALWDGDFWGESSRITHLGERGEQEWANALMQVILRELWSWDPTVLCLEARSLGFCPVFGKVIRINCPRDRREPWVRWFFGGWSTSWGGTRPSVISGHIWGMGRESLHPEQWSGQHGIIRPHRCCSAGTGITAIHDRGIIASGTTSCRHTPAKSHPDSLQRGKESSRFVRREALIRHCHQWNRRRNLEEIEILWPQQAFSVTRLMPYCEA